MSTTVRTDIHRPSAPEFDPENYVCVDVFDLHPDACQGLARMQTVNRLLADGYTRGGVHPMGQCSHCGARLRYTALMTHEPTRTYLWIGEQCLVGRFDSLTKGEFDKLRKAAALNRHRAAKADRIAALVDEYPLLADLTYPQITDESSEFVGSIAWKLRDHGELSERQIETACAALLREIEWRERDTQRATEAATAKPLPEPGRQIIEGEVLTVKWQDNYGYYGAGSLKMLVRHVDGWKVWGTVPSSIDPEQGDRVRFTATLKHSDDDPIVGFYSRPTKAEIL